MNRSFLVCAFIVITTASLTAQQSSQSDPYQGTSSPPPDDTIITATPAAPATAPAPKPSPDQPSYAPPSQPAAVRYTPLYQQQPEQQPSPANSALAAPEDGTDDGIVQIAADPEVRPALNQRGGAYDPDGDIVHPDPLIPGQLGEGTSIRVRLLGRLSTSQSQTGDSFRSRVASDVLQGGQVIIPAGAEIDGKVMDVSSGHAGGHGSMRLSPDTVILPDGSRFRLYAQLSSTPGSTTRVGSEGQIGPGSRLKHDSIEYGGAVGAGAVTGAVLAGPAGALAGTVIGAGVITAHLLISHPQAVLDSGTVLVFTLTERLSLVPAGATGY